MFMYVNAPEDVTTFFWSFCTFTELALWGFGGDANVERRKSSNKHPRAYLQNLIFGGGLFQ